MLHHGKHVPVLTIFIISKYIQVLSLKSGFNILCNFALQENVRIVLKIVIFFMVKKKERKKK